MFRAESMDLYISRFFGVFFQLAILRGERNKRGGASQAIRKKKKKKRQRHTEKRKAS